MDRKKVCIFTGTRADYGLLAPIMKLINDDDALNLQIIASGSHIPDEFGKSYKYIEDDGFAIDELIDIELNNDVTKSAGLGVIKYGEALRRLNPDIAVVLGDRYEALSFAFACNLCGVPLAHLYGGELTYGANDDSFRHAITKLSHLHFASCDIYRKRVVQMGEEPKRVFNVGSIGIENIRKMKLMSRDELEKSLALHLPDDFLLCTFHPVTMEKGSALAQVNELLKALSEINMFTIITKANADSEGQEINNALEIFAKDNSKIYLTASLGQIRYLSAMKYAKAVIGNSSSGILEAPAFKVPTINIGKRQEGRIMAKSIINCEPTKDSIIKAYKQVIELQIGDFCNPYEKSNTTKNIIEILKTFDIKDKVKYFYDI